MDKTIENDKSVRHFVTVPSVSEKIINWIYPPICGICGKLNQEFLCNKCNLYLRNQAIFELQKNKTQDKEFEEYLYIFKYEGIIREIILKYKFQEKSYLYKTIVNFLLKNEKLFEFLKNYDTIVPVPISKKRMKERGYNQSCLIANEIARHTNLDLDKYSILKTKNIIEQSKLNKQDRIKNIQGVYQLKDSKRLFNKRVLLLDDIYTTGSTVSECCKILKEAKPKKIGVLTIAKD